MLSVKHVTPLKSEKDEDGLIIPFYFCPMIFHVHFVTGPRVQLIPPRGARPLRPELPLRRCGLRCGDVLTAPLQAVPVRFAKICIAEMHVPAFTLVSFSLKFHKSLESLVNFVNNQSIESSCVRRWWLQRRPLRPSLPRAVS